MLDVKNVSIRDKPKAITAEDVIRRYDLEKLKSDRKTIRTLNDGLTKTDTLVENFITNISNHVENQEDGFITTWFSNEMPTLQNFPFKDFKEEEKEKRIGDLVYDRETGNIYQLEYENDEFIWLQLDDDYLKESMAIANATADTYDNKRNLFFEEPTTPYDAGDMWYTNGFIKRCRCSRSDQGYHTTDWVLQRDYSDESVLQETRAVLNQFKISVERDYITSVMLETTKNSINAQIESKTTEITNINNEIAGVKTNINNVSQIMTDSLSEITAKQTQLENGMQTANTKLANFQVTINEIKGVVEASTDTTKTEAGIGTVTISGIMNSEIIALKVHPTTTDLAYLYPSNNLYPSDDLYLKSRILLFQSEEETVEFELPCDLWFYSNEIYDEFILDLENNEMFCKKRVGIDINGNKYALENEDTIPYTFQSIVLSGGNYTVRFLSFDDAYISVQGLTVNINNSQFIPRVEAKSIVKQASDKLEEQVKLKLGTTEFESYRQQTATLISEKVSNSEYETYKTQTANNFSQTVKKGNVISEINQTNEKVKIQASKVDLEGYVTITNLKTSGQTIINGSNITTGIIDANKVTVKNINASNITTGTLNCNRLSGGTITGQKISGGTINGATITCDSGKIGGFEIGSNTITSTYDNYRVYVSNASNANKDFLVVRTGAEGNYKYPFYVRGDGKLHAENAEISGKITATSGSIGGSLVTSGINASNLTTGTVSSCNIDIYNGTGFLKMLHGSAYHPFVSALNVARGSGGIVFRSSGDRGSTGNNIGQIYADGNVIYISASNGTNIANYLKCGNIGISGNKVRGSSDSEITLNYSVVLKPNPNGGVYIWGTEAYNKILTSGGSPSTLAVKEYVTEKNTSDIPEILKSIKLYDYKYINEIENGKEDYGYIIDYLEEIPNIKKYLKFYEAERNGIKFKQLAHEQISKFLLGAVVELQKEIEELKVESRLS